MNGAGQLMMNRYRRTQNFATKRSAFTLIELLTVISITAVLLTIIIIPVVQSFNLTRAAQAYTEAQEKARILTERISREISNSAAVKDNAGIKGTLNLYLPKNPDVVAGPAVVRVPVQNVKLDIVRPAAGEPNQGPSGALQNPDLPVFDASGNIIGYKEDPTLQTPKGQNVLPVAQGFTVVRYWIGLRDPFSPYNNPYAGYESDSGVDYLARNGQRDNLYVLYRAEVPAFVWSSNQGRFVVNKSLFFDQDRDADANTTGPGFDDPDFFNANVALPAYSVADPDGTADPSKAQMIQNWLKRATVLTEVSRYDMIEFVVNKANREAQFTDVDGNGSPEAPRVIPLIQFRPTRVAGEPAEGQMAVRLGNESDFSTEMAPDVYRTAYGGWTSYVVRIWPTGFKQSLGFGDPAEWDDYLVARPDPATGSYVIYYYDPGSGLQDNVSGTPVFNISNYERAVTSGAAFPFNAGFTGLVLSQAERNRFVGFAPNPVLGKVNASFGSWQVGTNLAFLADNNPLADTGPELSPVQSNGAGAAYSGPGSQINSSFNRVWSENPSLQPNSVHRFIDLRVTPQADGSDGPMHPNPAIGFARATVTPGSEVVLGPDQLPGPNYGTPVRYTRVSGSQAPGPNQYKINYTDQPEPDYALAYPGMGVPPAAYDPLNLMSAVIQPRYKAGYIQLNSDPNVPLPNGTFKVSYRFQFTGGVRANDVAAVGAGGSRTDIFSVDYDTRQLMSVLLTIRNYPQSNLPNPQTITLSSTATVRNFLR